MNHDQRDQDSFKGNGDDDMHPSMFDEHVWHKLRSDHFQANEQATRHQRQSIGICTERRGANRTRWADESSHIWGSEEECSWEALVDLYDKSCEEVSEPSQQKPQEQSRSKPATRQGLLLSEPPKVHQLQHQLQQLELPEQERPQGPEKVAEQNSLQQQQQNMIPQQQQPQKQQRILAGAAELSQYKANETKKEKQRDWQFHESYPAPNQPSFATQTSLRAGAKQSAARIGDKQVGGLSKRKLLLADRVGKPSLHVQQHSEEWPGSQMQWPMAGRSCGTAEWKTYGSASDVGLQVPHATPVLRAGCNLSQAETRPAALIGQISLNGSRSDSLKAQLQALQREEPATVFMVQHISELGFSSADQLREYFARYGAVKDVYASHSCVKSRQPGVQWCMRAAALGFVVMQATEAVSQILADGPEHVVNGIEIKVNAYRRKAGDEAGKGVMSGAMDRPGQEAPNTPMAYSRDCYGYGIATMPTQFCYITEEALRNAMPDVYED